MTVIIGRHRTRIAGWNPFGGADFAFKSITYVAMWLLLCERYNCPIMVNAASNPNPNGIFDLRFQSRCFVYIVAAIQV